MSSSGFTVLYSSCSSHAPISTIYYSKSLFPEYDFFPLSNSQFSPTLWFLPGITFSLIISLSSWPQLSIQIPPFLSANLRGLIWAFSMAPSILYLLWAIWVIALSFLLKMKEHVLHLFCIFAVLTLEIFADLLRWAAICILREFLPN